MSPTPTRPSRGPGWRLHGDGRTITPGTVVAPDERLSWPRTVGIGVQHVMAMFGATVLVPALTGMPVTAAASKLCTLPPKTGQALIAALTMPGSCRSMP